MKASIATLVAFTLLGTTSCVLAASSVDLSVTGSITPSACTPSLSQGGAVDYGKIAATDLNVDNPTELPTVTLQLNVNCDAPTLFALHTQDNRQGSSNYVHPRNYGLGLINGDQKLGSYQIDVFNPVADTTVSPLFSADKGATWISNPTGTYFEPGAWVAFGDPSSGAPFMPKALLSVTADLPITASIAPTSGLTLIEEVPLDGSATLEVLYL
ncbi:DUF1120 domain-containing protein [Pseudomonas sp. HN11]|uniref:DUF1120 domain-containing protein n=1 Tax=Pseudomonas sp. HN11 TaxID=1344094 RepID=UPI001F2F778D|nr:DUF1120 domain-containing protein [Pseudomonas sp. HN11]UII72538.1 DUF1120 domain-containing protein [Pseudomonas sp. HN11]